MKIIEHAFSILLLSCATQISFALPQVEDADEPIPVNTGSYLTSNGPVVESTVSSVTVQKNTIIGDELLTRLRALEGQVQDLQGRVDELQHALKQSQAEHAQQFLILNKKLAETSAKSAPAPLSMPVNTAKKPTIANAPAAALTPDAQEKATYDAAYGLVSAKAYADAIEAFKGYLTIYPDGKYSANANYWLGELNASQQAYSDALKYLQVVADKYPQSSKAPDALLKLGIINKRLNDNVKAQQWFAEVIKEYPDSQSAKSAKEYIS